MLGLRLNVNSSCNLRCKHCYYLEKVGFTGEEMSLFDAKNIVDQAYELYGQNLYIVVMGGGEPLMYSYLFELLEYISLNKKIPVSITTNACLISENNLKKFKEYNVLLMISIEGKEKYNDRVRGKGVFKKIIETIIKAKQIGNRVSLNITVNKNNLSHISYIIILLNKYVEYITFSRYIPYLKNNIVKELSKQEYVLLDKIIKNYYELGFKSRQENFFRRNNKKTKINYNIYKDLRALYVLPNMKIYPAWDLIDYELGNLKNESLEEILKNGKLEKLYNPNNLNGEFCSNCKYKYSCSGDRGVAYFYTGNFWGDDIQCPFFIQNV